MPFAPVQLPADVDEGCVALCRAMNQLPGIRTVQSCEGHGEQPYRIFFDAENLEALPPLLYYFNACHCGYAGWGITAHTDCAMSPVSFMVEGPVGPKGVRQSEKIAQLLEEHVEVVISRGGARL